ncbi:hypothetical protein C4E44_00630 [Pseudomonas sp. MWU12-2312b]|nr:hypothetical protein C4E44_00630 [Pseudomonas sp. MWU12-2312b]
MNEVENKFNPVVRDNDHLSVANRAIPKAAGRVIGYYQVNDDKEEEVELRDVYCYFWGAERSFNLAALDTSHETRVHLVGEGLEQGRTYPISFEENDFQLWFDKVGVTTGNESIQRRSLGGELTVMFIEESRKSVEGRFYFTFLQENPNTSFSQKINLNFTFSVVAGN